jgi:hypothetical protein
MPVARIVSGFRSLALPVEAAIGTETVAWAPWDEDESQAAPALLMRPVRSTQDRSFWKKIVAFIGDRLFFNGLYHKNPWAYLRYLLSKHELLKVLTSDEGLIIVRACR